MDFVEHDGAVTCGRLAGEGLPVSVVYRPLQSGAIAGESVICAVPELECRRIGHNDGAMENPGDVTVLLAQLKNGNNTAESRLLDLVYPELRRIARRYLSRERREHTLAATALAHDAYLQLVGQNRKELQNRSHFYAIAAKLMRRILVDHARRKKAEKRGGKYYQVELTDALALAEERIEQILSIDEALSRLAAFDPRRSKVVELRFFGGMTEEEVAEVLDVAPRTVKRDWNIAKAWLYGELFGGTEVT